MPLQCRISDLCLATQIQKFDYCTTNLVVLMFLDRFDQRFHLAGLGHHEKNRKRVVGFFSAITHQIIDCLSRYAGSGYCRTDILPSFRRALFQRAIKQIDCSRGLQLSQGSGRRVADVRRRVVKRVCDNIECLAGSGTSQFSHCRRPLVRIDAGKIGRNSSRYFTRSCLRP